MEQFKSVCRNPWCKATFLYTEVDMITPNTNKTINNINSVLDESVEKLPPSTCPKCRSFDSELSGGVSWKTKEYDGSRFDGMPHEIRYKVTNYK